MLRRPFFALLMVAAGSSAATACDDYRYGYGGSYYPGFDLCRQYESCGTCTPVLGCGWCSTPGGESACRHGPGECRGDSFTFTWEPRACAALPGDGGGVDGGTGTDSGGSAVQDAMTSPVDATVSVVDASGTGGTSGTALDASQRDSGSPLVDASRTDAAQ